MRLVMLSLVTNYRSHGDPEDYTELEFTLNMFDVLATYFKILLGLVQMNKFACVALEASAVRKSIIFGEDDIKVIQKKLITDKLRVNIYTVLFVVVTSVTSAISISYLW
jgi:nucleoside permease NupC